MLVFQKIPVYTDLKIGSRGLITQTRHFIVMVSLTYTGFHDGEPLVVQIDAQGCLILSVVREHQHTGTYKVERHGKATEHRNRVFL